MTNGKTRSSAKIEFRTKGYEYIRHHYNGDIRQVFTHQLVAIANGHDPYKVFCDEYNVHHENEVKWDNRIDNLTLMTRSDHMRHHASERTFERKTWYSEEELLGWIEAFVEEVGYVPTQNDMDACPGPSKQPFINRFGSWPNAIIAAGYTPRGSRK